MKGILGKKIGMTHMFTENGDAVPVTLIETGPCFITQIKTQKTDGYESVQMGFGKVKMDNLTKPESGHLSKAGAPPLKYLAEIQVDDHGDLKVGQEIKVDVFDEGDLVDVSGIAKGKGFQGVVKRWNFHTRPATHGHHFRRAPGSIGMAATPSRVLKGKKLPGRMGGSRKTASALEVMKVEEKNNILAVKGSIPGSKGGYLVVRESKRSHK